MIHSRFIRDLQFQFVSVALRIDKCIASLNFALQLLLSNHLLLLAALLAEFALIQSFKCTAAELDYSSKHK